MSRSIWFHQVERPVHGLNAFRVLDSRHSSRNSHMLQFSMDYSTSSNTFDAETNLELALRASLREGVLNTKYSTPLFCIASMCTVFQSLLRFLHCESPSTRWLKRPSTDCLPRRWESKRASDERADCVEQRACSWRHDHRQQLGRHTKTKADDENDRSIFNNVCVHA